MANPLTEEKELYERMRSEDVSIKKDVWDFMYHRVNHSITAILFVCQRRIDNREAMPIVEAGNILAWVRDIKNATSAITASSRDIPVLPQFEEGIPLNSIVQELIAHQFGNDLYAIELMLQDAIEPLSTAPVPVEVLQKIIVHARAIHAFLDKFRDTIQWKESEGKYLNLYEALQDGLLMTDLKGHIFEINHAYLKMLDYTEEELRKLTCRDVTPERWWQMEEELIADLITRRRDFVEYEKEYVRKDGTIFPVALKIWLIKDKQGNPLGMWRIARDITERKRAQKEFEEEIVASYAVIDNISAGLTLSDKRGRFVIFNHAMQQVTGYTLEEINTQGLDVLLYPDPEERKKAIARLDGISWGKGTADVPTKIMVKDGSCKILSVSTSLIKYKGSDMFLSVWRDVTESVRLQDALRDSETRFRRLFESAQDGILILDADTAQIKEANPFLIDMLGYSREELLGKRLWEVGAFGDIEKSKAAFQTLRNKGYVRYEDLPFRTKGGRAINVEFVSNVYKVDYGDVIQCNIRDITERWNLEEERERLNKRLQQLALKDSHTGLYNHRYLKDVIKVNFARATRQGAPLSAIMMDIDYFKSINDVYGHLFGDLVLKQIAGRLITAVRPYDVVIRYGGEEFIIISADTDRASARVLARRILDKVDSFSFGNKAHRVKLKVSLGVASYPEDAIQRSGELVDLADKLMNKAKENGGNRVYSSLETRKTDGTARGIAGARSLREKIEKLTSRASQGLIEETLAFAKEIGLKDHYPGDSGEIAANYAVHVSRELRVPEGKIEFIKQAAMLYDLGKAGISERILQKRSRLTRREYNEIRQHPQIGVDIIRPIHSLRPIIPYLLHHHERWNGEGYPQGLAGPKIPLGARIIAVVDVYKSLVADRPYRRAYPRRKALEIIREGAGTFFDPAIVKAFETVARREERTVS